MWNEPTLEELNRIPGLYTTQRTPLNEKVIYEHFFLFGCDWYVAEYSQKEQLFWGFAILHNDLQNAEWGYISYQELKDINIDGFEVDRELDWKVKKANEVENIVQAKGICIITLWMNFCH
jgi:hypothetical protein